MRNPDRLEQIYDIVLTLHKKYFPDWRIMQLMNNFFMWHYNKYKTDGYYLEDIEFIAKFKNFVREVTGDYFD